MSRTFLMQYGRVTACFLMLLVTAAPAWALSISTGPNGSNVQALHALGYTGQNVKIGFLSVDNVYADHHAFLEKDESGTPIPGTSRVIIVNPPGVDVKLSSHDTQMAGIMISSGAPAEPHQIGVAPGATLYNARISGGVQQAIDALLAHGCNVIVSGFMFLSEPHQNNGESNITKMYDYYAFSNVIFAHAAGNYSSPSGDSPGYPYYTPPGIPGDAYNGITTGGLVKLSSDAYHRIGLHSLHGPTHDGRRKPEVATPAPDQRVPNTGGVNAWTTTSGPTTGYTSWAVPHTAGVAAVLLDYAQTHGQEHADRSEVIKAVMVNSTFPNILAKNGTWTDPANVTWHADRGYGRLDALRAYETLSAPKITPGQTANASKGWNYQQFTRKSPISDSYFIYGTQNSRLVTTMTWHRKVTSSFSAESSLNIGLDIYSPQGQLILSLSGGKDNLRKADILLETDGVYEVRIYKNRIQTGADEDRYYALAFEVLEPLAGDWNTDYIVDTGDLAEMLDCWLVGCKLDAFEILSSQWLMIDPRYWGP